MRCTNCGWENSGDRSNCEKCNSPLSNYAMREHAVTDVYARRTVNENIGINVGRPTVCEQGIVRVVLNAVILFCRVCRNARIVTVPDKLRQV